MALAPVSGLSVAFEADALDVSPEWTRLDTHLDIRVQRVSIKRGRPDEKAKTDIGRFTASGLDFTGVLDPTNASGPWFGLLDPVKQAAYGLRNPVTGEWATLFRGYVDELRPVLDITGKFMSWTLDLVDALDIFSDAEIIPDQAGNVVPSESTGDVFYDPVTTIGDRILAAVADAALSVGATAWPPELLEVFTGNVKGKGAPYPARTPLLQVMQDAGDAEFPGVANLFVAKDGVVTFHGRLARFNPDDPQYRINRWKVGDVKAFDEDASVAVASELEFSRGKANLVNAAIATPRDIEEADIAGQFVADIASVTKYGARSISFDSLQTDGHADGSTTDLVETRKFATYYVENGRTPRNRIDKIVFRPPPSEARSPAQWALICGVDISDIVHVKTTHPGGGGFDEDFFVEGVSYEIVPMTATHPEVTLTLEVSPAAYYETSPF